MCRDMKIPYKAAVVMYVCIYDGRYKGAQTVIEDDGGSR